MIKFFFRIACLLFIFCQLGCKDYPKDPAGTLNNIKNTHQIKIGIVKHAPWVENLDPPKGIEVKIIQDYAKYLDAKIQWRTDGEHVLISQLEQGRIDLIIGGFTTKTPWKEQIAITRPYSNNDGINHVLILRSGENAFLINLEKFLSDYQHAAHN